VEFAVVSLQAGLSLRRLAGEGAHVAFPSPACGRGLGEGALAFFVVRRLGSSRRPTHVPVGSSRIPAGRFLFLTPGILPSALRASFAVRAAPAAQCLSEEKEPKERTPRQRRPPGILPCGCVNVGRGSPTMHPASRRTRARPARAPAGLIDRRPPALKGTRESGAHRARKARAAL